MPVMRAHAMRDAVIESGSDDIARDQLKNAAVNGIPSTTGSCCCFAL